MLDFDEEKSKINFYMDAVLVLIADTWINVASLVTLLCLYDPRGPMFLGAWLSEEYYSFFPFGILVIMFHATICMYTAVSVSICLYFIVTYLYYVSIFFCKELKLGSSPVSYRTSNLLREPSNLRHIYRCFQVLNANAMGFLGPFFAVTHTLCVITPVLCSSILIKYWNIMDMLTKGPIILSLVVSMGYWMFVLQIGKYLFVRSKKVLGSWDRKIWKHGIENKVMRRFRKSCRPVVICWGKSFVLKRITQFNYVKGIFRSTFKLLLTSKR